MWEEGCKGMSDGLVGKEGRGGSWIGKEWISWMIGIIGWDLCMDALTPDDK